MCIAAGIAGVGCGELHGTRNSGQEPARGRLGCALTAIIQPMPDIPLHTSLLMVVAQVSRLNTAGQGTSASRAPVARVFSAYGIDTTAGQLPPAVSCC
jgi:hypothetical protein